MFEPAVFTRRASHAAALVAVAACTFSALATRADAGVRWASRPAFVRDTSYGVVYNFPALGTQGGTGPTAALTLVGGALYGTTYNGGLLSNPPCEGGCGTVFAIAKNGKERVVYSLGSTSGDGTNPLGGVIGERGLLYGTTAFGGSANLGAVFAVSPAGQVQTLHSFTGADGNQPQAGLVAGGHGEFYGTTYYGGASSEGTVFAVDSKGNESVVYSFTGANGDGRNPTDGLLYDGHGHLYGTTYAGGAFNGTVFEVTTKGVEHVIYQFQGKPDGCFPVGGLIADAQGNLYGTTSCGGANGNGTVFAIDTSGKEHVLYSFKGGSDGQNPQAGVVTDGHGHLFGTTRDGGGQGNGGSQGTVFEVDIASGKEMVLHAFAYNPFGSKPNYDGAHPLAPVVVDGKHLYGTTQQGGTGGSGTVFELSV